MAKYAENTSVSADKSRAEIERTLQRYGATAFSYGWEGSKAMIAFIIENRHVRFTLDMPDINDEKFQLTPTQKWARSPVQIQEAYEKATRQRWRALALVVKAKLEAVDAQITTIEQEFLAHIVLPDNRTVGEWVRPEIEKAYINGNMPKLLMAGTLE